MNPVIQDAALIVLGSTFLLVVVALLAATMQDRRTRQLREAAEEMGFSFHKEDPALALDLFGPVQGLRVINVIRGQAQGLEVVVFDLHRAMPAADTMVHLRLSMLAFLDNEAHWPAFALRPRRYKRFLSRLAGEGRTLFDDDKAFAFANVLEARDEEAVRPLFTEEVRRYFAERPGQWVEAKEKLLIRTRGRLVAPGELRAFLQDGFQVLNLLETGEHKM
jgi:hypothetical protein